MLTKEAANALLKTLEEPPSHVIFILATTDPDKLPQTIVSRCQKIIFKQPDLATLTDRLTFVAEQEGKKLSKESGELLARHGKGSYRDALGMLEQVLAISKKEVNHDDVIGLLGTPDKELLLSLVQSVCIKNTKEITETLKTLQDSHGVALRAYDELIELIRQGLLIRIGEVKETSELARLATEYPHTIGSKTILELLEKRHLLEVSDSHAWTAFGAILLFIVEG